MTPESDSQFLHFLHVDPAETSIEAQDRVRRIVSPSGIRFRNGTMYLTLDATAELAQAVVDGRIAGDVDRASRMLDDLEGPTPYLTIAAAITICESVIASNGADGDVEKARQMIEYLKSLQS